MKFLIVALLAVAVANAMEILPVDVEFDTRGGRYNTVAPNGDSCVCIPRAESLMVESSEISAESSEASSESRPLPQVDDSDRIVVINGQPELVSHLAPEVYDNGRNVIVDNSEPRPSPQVYDNGRNVVYGNPEPRPSPQVHDRNLINDSEPRPSPQVHDRNVINSQPEIIPESKPAAVPLECEQYLSGYQAPSYPVRSSYYYDDDSRVPRMTATRKGALKPRRLVRYQ